MAGLEAVVSTAWFGLLLFSVMDPQRLLTHVDFRDKVLKILGSLAKLKALSLSENALAARIEQAALSASTVSGNSVENGFNKAGVSYPEKRQAALLGLAKELSRVRKWLKFLRVLRGWKNIPASLKTGDLATTLEALADLTQMVSEDLNNLHVAGVWEGLLGLPPINVRIKP